MTVLIEVEGQVLPVPRPTGRAPGNRKLTAYDLRESHDPHPDRPTWCICGGPLNLALTRCIDSGWGWAPSAEAEGPAACTAECLDQAADRLLNQPPTFGGWADEATGRYCTCGAGIGQGYKLEDGSTVRGDGQGGTTITPAEYLDRRAALEIWQ